MAKNIGLLTSGGDCPGLNAAIRAIGKTAISKYDMEVTGFRDGFRGLVENRTITLDNAALSGILTVGGTILGTSRVKPHKMAVGDQVVDMTDVIVENYYKNNLDALICLGGNGTLKNAYKLHQKGLNILTLPKTIDNDVEGTDVTFGFDTAFGIAAEAIDRLHSTAESHHRIIVVEIMGHTAGWLALAAGIAGGADVILIPEIPYSASVIANAILDRAMKGKRFSIVAIAEGAMNTEDFNAMKSLKDYKKNEQDTQAKSGMKVKLKALEAAHAGNAGRLSAELQEKTGLESRLTILGHIQRGGIPSSADRLLATNMGTAAVDFINEGLTGVMVASRGDKILPVPLIDVVGRTKLVPSGHQWVVSARNVGTCFGD